MPSGPRVDTLNNRARFSENPHIGGKRYNLTIDASSGTGVPNFAVSRCHRRARGSLMLPQALMDIVQARLGTIGVGTRPARTPTATKAQHRDDAE